MNLYADKFEEHLASQPDNSRWDGYCRGDTSFEVDQGSRVISNTTSGGGYLVTVTELWSAELSVFEVAIDGSRVHFTDELAQAIIVARWWLAGCPA